MDRLREARNEAKADRSALKIARKGYRATKRKELVSEYKTKAKRDARARRPSARSRLAKGLTKGLKDVKKRNAKREKSEPMRKNVWDMSR